VKESKVFKSAISGEEKKEGEKVIIPKEIEAEVIKKEKVKENA